MALVDPHALDGLEGVTLLDEELGRHRARRPSARAGQARALERLAGEALVTSRAGSALRDALVALVPGGRIVAEVNELDTVRELIARGSAFLSCPVRSSRHTATAWQSVR